MSSNNNQNSSTSRHNTNSSEQEMDPLELALLKRVEESRKTRRAEVKVIGGIRTKQPQQQQQRRRPITTQPATAAAKSNDNNKEKNSQLHQQQPPLMTQQGSHLRPQETLTGQEMMISRQSRTNISGDGASHSISSKRVRDGNSEVAVDVVLQEGKHEERVKTTSTKKAKESAEDADAGDKTQPKEMGTNTNNNNNNIDRLDQLKRKHARYYSKLREILIISASTATTVTPKQHQLPVVSEQKPHHNASANATPTISPSREEGEGDGDESDDNSSQQGAPHRAEAAVDALALSFCAIDPDVETRKRVIRVLSDPVHGPSWAQVLLRVKSANNRTLRERKNEEGESEKEEEEEEGVLAGSGRGRRRLMTAEMFSQLSERELLQTPSQAAARADRIQAKINQEEWELAQQRVTTDLHPCPACDHPKSFVLSSREVTSEKWAACGDDDKRRLLQCMNCEYQFNA